MNDRQEIVDELVLREQIRKVIKIVRNRKAERLNEEKELRSVIRKLILSEAAAISNKTPHRSTGINVLEDLLNKVLTNIETDYKALTTKPEQKKSYRAHIVKGIMNILAPSRALADEPNDIIPSSIKEATEPLEEEDIDITIDPEEEGPNLGQEAFLDVDAGDPEEEDQFTIAGQNETGRNIAAMTFRGGLQKNILDHYELLADDEDREIFYNYLITNIKLWMDKWDDEMSTDLEEPSTPEYEEAADEAEAEEASAAPEDETFEFEG
jgi:hypothetical protein